VREFVLAAIDGLAESFDLLQLLLAQLVDFVVECHGVLFLTEWNGDYKQPVCGFRREVWATELLSNRKNARSCAKRLAVLDVLFRSG
jgi:hypothetical protein